ncbi:MAG: hypothetical protein JSW60_05935 [Thermoplasmatales archaeon]|nr:MAG: hypothetical protein JSW60_05935 [Thermoplasmatales archaeon]
MEIIPFIRLKKRKIITEKGDLLSLDETRKLVNKEGQIYILDLDGIEKNRPNLCLYPKISEFQKIWVDAGPRVLGDIVDTVMAGAANITVRKKLWPDLHVPSIKEITESRIYTDIDTTTHNMYGVDFSLLDYIDGLVNFTSKNHIENDFKFSSHLKDLCAKYKMYAYESSPENFPYWKTLGVAGLLIDINEIKEAHRNGI